MENLKEIEPQKDDYILFDSKAYVYNENYLWNLFRNENQFENLIAGSPDPVLTSLVAGTIIGNMIEDGKIWLMILGKASSGKTYTVNLFKTLEQHKILYYVGKFTSASLFSVRNYEKSMINQVAKGGTIICKDFSSFLARGMANYYKIMNMLREIYDGYYEDRTVEGVYRWVGKIGMIVCATLIIQKRRLYMYEMGDRFVYYKINPQFQPILCTADLGQYILENCYDRLLKKDGSLISLCDIENKHKKEIELIAEMIEISRTANPLKHRKFREYVIEPNLHFRLVHQLNTLAAGLAIAYNYSCVNEKIIKILLELVYRGSLERYAKIINCIFKEKITNGRVIKQHYNLSKVIFQYALQDLQEFGLLTINNDTIEPAEKFKIIFENY
ncbi:MAG: hypothetical protein QXV73_04555 [Candidatus Micrarchaeia archaeon]